MTESKLKLLIGQINPIVGDISHNTEKIVKIIEAYQNVDLIIFPEMALVGYPLMDHIYDPLIRENNKKSIELIQHIKSDAAILLGTFTEPKELEKKIPTFLKSSILFQNQYLKFL